MTSLFLILSGISGFLAVALGAFGAHGLQSKILPFDDGLQRMKWWETAAHYHLVHAVVIFGVALLSLKLESKVLAACGWSFFVGTLLFSGSLYAMTITGVRWLGAVTPIGGLFFLLGWALICYLAIAYPIQS